MTTEAIMELCRRDEALRVRQMRNAWARTILFAVLAIANTSFAAGSIIMAGTSSTLPWALNVGFTVMGAGFAVLFWLERKQWIALRAMSSPPSP